MVMTMTQATKLLCLVQLLMGEIPERSVFRQKGIKNALKPYLELTQVLNILFSNEISQYGL
jgi:26S proteasome regulatory subunit N3